MPRNDRSLPHVVGLVMTTMPPGRAIVNMEEISMRLSMMIYGIEFYKRHSQWFNWLADELGVGELPEWEQMREMWDRLVERLPVLEGGDSDIVYVPGICPICATICMGHRKGGVEDDREANLAEAVTRALDAITGQEGGIQEGPQGHTADIAPGETVQLASDEEWCKVHGIVQTGHVCGQGRENGGLLNHQGEVS